MLYIKSYKIGPWKWTRFLWPLLFLVLTSCTADFKEAVGVNYIILKSENVSANDQGEVGGRGAILFKSPLRSIRSSEHFYLQGRLDKVGSVITIVSHAVDENFNKSVKVQFEREQQSVLSLKIGLEGQEFFELAHFENLINAAGEFSVRIELHENGDEGIRLIFWSVLKKSLAERWQEKKTFHLKNAEYDSRLNGDSFYKHGKGVLWGASFYDAYITSLINEAPYVQ